ncbi:hypothetical protein GCM10010466_08730 [Planomonospora alba]|uniref:Bacterial transcriptional activator domain-containing protein n=1 Tax=Planomonospora alba TaxID=161354 RepID=A0ABP6MRJ5_9ACTN
MILIRLLRALLATAVLVTVVIGFPVLFHSVAGFPFPDHFPTVQEVADRLTSRDDGTLFISVVEIVAWGAWASFCLTVVMEIVARLRGLRAAPQLRGLGGMQRLAAYLVASAALAVSAPVSAATAAVAPPPPVAAMAPLHPQLADHLDASEERFHRVEPGDTLREIADKRLGNPRRWVKIWKLNAYSRQPDGRVFTDPDLIHPRWKLRLPTGKPPAAEPARKDPAADSSARGIRLPKPGAVQTPSAKPSVEQAFRSSEAIELSSGSLVAFAYAAGISTAYAANLLHRRRRRIPPSIPEGVQITPEPEPAPAVRELRRAHRRTFTERGEDVPTDAELLRQADSTDVPDGTAIGGRPDGDPVRLQLAGLRLGVTGPGAPNVARYLIVDLLRQASDFRAEVVLCTALAESLLGLPADEPDVMARAVPGLTVVPSPEEALKRFEETHFTRRRMLLEREASTLGELRERDPGEVLPVVVLVAEPDDEASKRITALLGSGQSTGMGALVLGPWTGSTTCEVDDDHRIRGVEGPLAETFEGAQLFHITADEAAAHLRELVPPSETETEEEPSSPADADAWDGPEPVRLSILGPPTVRVRGRSQPLGLSWLQLNTLAYLALHPHGVTRDQLTTALWPDEVCKDIHNTLRHLRNALTTATGYVNPEPRKAPFINASTTKDSAVYRIDPKLVSVDLWDYQAALEQVRTASRSADRLAALQKAAALCQGELAHGLNTEWIEEHRYPLTRSQADTLSQLAEAYETVDPERALDALERARSLDPDVEETYVRIVRLQLRLGRRDEAGRTVQLLRQHQSTLGIDPDLLIEKRLFEILRTGEPSAK